MTRFVYTWKWLSAFSSTDPEDLHSGEDQPDACIANHPPLDENNPPRYFQTKEKCIQDGMMWAPFHVQHEYMVIEPVKYQPQNESFLTREHRLVSFRDWPHQMNPSKEDLSETGFFYLQNCDRVKCFYCGIVLRNWQRSDSAQGEHRKHSPECLFAFLHK